MISSHPAWFRRRGTTIVETAVVLLVVFMFIFAIFEYGRYLMISDLVNNATREGASAVATTNTQNTASIQNTVVYYLAGQQIMNSSGNPLSASDVLVYQANPATGLPASPDSLWYDAPFGASIVVQVTCTYTPMFPTFGFLPKTFQIKSTSMMSSEAN